MNQQVSMSTVTVKGQVVIPAKLRKKVGLKKGTRVYMEERNGDIIIHPATPEFYDRKLKELAGLCCAGCVLTLHCGKYSPSHCKWQVWQMASAVVFSLAPLPLKKAEVNRKKARHVEEDFLQYAQEAPHR